MSLAHLNKMPPQVLIWGGTGQARVVRPIIEYYGSKVIAVFDDTPGLPPPFPDVPLFEGKKEFGAWRRTVDPQEIGFCIAIGNPHGQVRLDFHEQLCGQGFRPITIAHPTAWIDESVTVGEGSQIMAGAILCAESVLGKQCIINTKASVDHEDILEDGVEIAPGATLCGLVHIEKCAWVCAGATILPRKRVGTSSIVGAGAVVVRDVPPNTVVVGVPARFHKSVVPG